MVKETLPGGGGLSGGAVVAGDKGGIGVKGMTAAVKQALRKMAI